MESPVFSEITGEAEGCSSTESGWTIYLASPPHDVGDDDDDDDGDGDGELDSDAGVGFHESNGENRAEEDDSLASDASTGNIEKNVTAMDDHVNHRDYDDYLSPDDGYSKLSTNVKNQVKKMEKKEERRCFGGLFKRDRTSSSCSSKIWKTKLRW